MRKSIYTYAMVLAMPIIALMTSCEPKELTPDEVFEKIDSTSLDEMLKAENEAWDGQYRIYTLDEFYNEFHKTEEGNWYSDTTQYRERAYNAKYKIYVYSLDTIKKDTIGIYIRGRVTTDDYGGNFYKSMVIQQVVDGKQQNLRISVDLGSGGGMFQIGQEVIIRCNGLALGLYANQPQLCIPSYNNNIFAMNATQKTGWAPGRIPGSVFRRVAHMIGAPDPTKLKYDTLTLTQLYKEIQMIPKPVNTTTMNEVRRADGRLIVLKDVYFTGQYLDNENIVNCVVGHPDTVGGANVFAPSTQNIGYPQSRFLGAAGTTNKIMCSNSEYSKFAYYYLPGASKAGVTDCKNWKGTVTGILGWYFDTASKLENSEKSPVPNSYTYSWSITPRGIKGFGISDINVQKKTKIDGRDTTLIWQPVEYDPNDK